MEARIDSALQKLTAAMAEDDGEAADCVMRSLYRSVLHTVAGGAENAAELAALALRAEGIRWVRRD